MSVCIFKFSKPFQKARPSSVLLDSRALAPCRRRNPQPCVYIMTGLHCSSSCLYAWGSGRAGCVRQPCYGLFIFKSGGNSTGLREALAGPAGPHSRLRRLTSAPPWEWPTLLFIYISRSEHTVQHTVVLYQCFLNWSDFNEIMRFISLLAQERGFPWIMYAFP